MPEDTCFIQLKRSFILFVTVKLDNANSVQYGLPKDQIRKLQRVLNSAARLLTGIHKYDHITPGFLLSNAS